MKPYGHENDLDWLFNFLVSDRIVTAIGKAIREAGGATTSKTYHYWNSSHKSKEYRLESLWERLMRKLWSGEWNIYDLWKGGQSQSPSPPQPQET